MFKLNSSAIAFNQFCIYFIYAHFTHHYLIPKEKGWKRELQVFPIFILLLLPTSSVLLYSLVIKAIIMIVVFFSAFCYVYQFDIKKFIIAFFSIYAATFLAEFPIDILILILGIPISEISSFQILCFLPILLVNTVFVFNCILKFAKKPCILPKSFFLICITQTIIGMIVLIRTTPYQYSVIIFLIILLILLECYLFVTFKNRQENIFNYQKQHYINKQLQTIYQSELDAYLAMKDETQIRQSLRHDLLNEIQIISYLENTGKL